MEFFSTREIAIIIWSLIIIVLLLINKNIRVSIYKLLDAIINRKILTPFIIMISYLGIILLFMVKLRLKKYISLKEIILWLIFSGVSLCYGVIGNPPRKNYFKRIVKENIKMIIFIEFIISTFTFSLIIELIIIPVITFLFILEAFLDNKEYENIKEIISFILGIIGFIILYKSFSLAIKNYRELNVVENFIDIGTPIVLSILYFPLIYVFGICFNYDNILYRLKIKLTNRVKVIVNNYNNGNKKYDYIVEVVEDVSIGKVKRKSIELILNKEYNLKDLENICMEQFSLFNYKNDVVWINIAGSQESYVISNWIIQAQWINPKLDSHFVPHSLKGFKKDGIFFQYNNSYNEIQKYYKNNIFIDDRTLIIKSLKLYDEISKEIAPLLDSFRNIEYEKFVNECNRYSEYVRKKSLEYDDIGITKTVSLSKYLGLFQDYIICIENIMLYTLDESRDPKNKELLVNNMMKSLESIVIQIEDRRYYWMNSKSITTEDISNILTDMNVQN